MGSCTICYRAKDLNKVAAGTFSHTYNSRGQIEVVFYGFYHLFSSVLGLLVCFDKFFKFCHLILVFLGGYRLVPSRWLLFYFTK